MSVQEIALTNSGGNNFAIANKTLGVIGMICSPMLIFAAFFFAGNGQASPHPFLAGLGGVLYMLGAMASATGMRNLRVTGSGAGAKILYVVQMIGLALAMTFDVLENAAPHLRDTAIYFITDMAYPFSHTLMLIVGIAIIRAGIWKGWRRIPAFLVGAALPAFIILSAIFGREAVPSVFPVFVTIGFFLLGLAVYARDSRFKIQD